MTKAMVPALAASVNLLQALQQKELEQSLPEPALLLAGFVLAHAAWSISEAEDGELLVPLAVVERDGERELFRFEADSQEAAIAEGKAAMAKLGESVDVWAFARDGIFREADPVDAISVDFWAQGMRSPASIIQRYEPFATKKKFRIIGDPMVVLDGSLQEPEPSTRVMAGIQRGVQEHPLVKTLWPVWQQ